MSNPDTEVGARDANTNTDTGSDLGSLVNDYGLSDAFRASTVSERIVFGDDCARASVVRALGDGALSRRALADAGRAVPDRPGSGAAGPGGGPARAAASPLTGWRCVCGRIRHRGACFSVDLSGIPDSGDFGGAL